MTTRKAIKIRLYPDAAQQVLFARTAGCRRFVYNLGLEQRRLFSHKGRPISYYAQRAELKDLKAEAPWLAEVPHHCLQEALVDLDRAYQRFFAGFGGYPRPQRKGERDSFRFPDANQIRLDATAIGPKGRGFRLFLPKAGWVAGVLHRPLPDEARLKSVTVSRDGDWWMASLLFAVPETAAPALLPGAIGLDLGVVQAVAGSDGSLYAVPLPTRRERDHERRLARAITRKKKGSINRRKAARALARFKAAQARRRKDRIHKITTTIAKSHGIVVLEDLRVRAMTASARGTVTKPGRNVRQKAGLNRSLLAVGFGLISQVFEYKLAREGGILVVVDPRYTSRTCPECGHVSAGNRPRRDLFRCERCGHQDHADTNAARNILARGLEQLGVVANDLEPAGGLPVAACGDLGTSRSAKQETTGRKPGKKAA